MRKIIIGAFLLCLSVASHAMSFPHAKELYNNMVKNAKIPNAPPLNYDPAEDFNAYWNGQSITLQKGILKAINSDDEMVFVLGHELGHKFYGHSSSTIPNEYQADQWGYGTVKRSGYNQCQAREVFKKFPGGWTQGSSDHPAPKDRYNKLPC